LKRWFLLLLCAMLPLSGCAQSSKQKYSAEIYGAFDTVTTVTAYCSSEKEFNAFRDKTEKLLLYYSRLYDIYMDYQDVEGIYAVNEAAGDHPVKVEPEVMSLLRFGIESYELTQGRVNIAMGSVLSIWHDLREQAQTDPASAKLPEESQLRSAAQHCDLMKLQLDDDAGTAYLEDPEMRLDVGAIAKGYAAQQVYEKLVKAGYQNFVLSAGGNVIAAGTPEGRDSWSVGIESPLENGDLIDTVSCKNQAVVTSGGYERFYTVDGKQYHHIVDPDTLYPAEYVKSATVIYSDSSLADAFSTAMFLMTPEKSLALAKKYPGMRIILMDANGKIIDSAKQ